MTLSHFTGCLWFAIGARDTSETTWVQVGGYTTQGPGRSPGTKPWDEAQWGTMDPQVNQQFMLLNMAIYAIEIVDLPIKMFIDFP